MADHHGVVERDDGKARIVALAVEELLQQPDFFGLDHRIDSGKSRMRHRIDCGPVIEALWTNLHDRQPTKSASPW